MQSTGASIIGLYCSLLSLSVPKPSKPCHVCLHLLTVDKESLDLSSDSEFELLHLTDCGGLKYSSDPVLDSILVLWKRFYAIENNKELLAKLVSGPSKKISVEFTLMYLEDSDNRDTNIWNLIVFNCEIFNLSILQKLVFTAANRFLAIKSRIILL